MKQNELEIQNNLRIRYGPKNHKAYIGTRPLLCKECTRNIPTRTKQEQTIAAKQGYQYIYNGDHHLICPSCGKKVNVLKTYDDWKHDEQAKAENEQENIKLIFLDKDWETGQDYYKLSCKPKKHLLSRIRPYFRNYNLKPSDTDTMLGNRIAGWLTTEPEKVEAILNVKEKHKVRNVEDTQVEIERRENMLRRNRLNNLIEGHFLEHGSIPTQKVNPGNMRNIHGHDKVFLFDRNEIFVTRENWMDGFLGVDYSTELEGMIKEYCLLP